MIRAAAHLSLAAFVVAQCAPRCDAALDIVVTSGTASPDGNGVLDLLNAPSINSSGQLAFVTQLSGTSGGTSDNLAMLRRDTNGTLTKISRSGSTFNGKTIISWFPASAYMLGSGDVVSVVALAPTPAELLHTTGTGGRR